ncbi:MAG TPA: xanthine dehydrogenase family protein molybdopterin-binding subunit [Pseudorhizobium sp.]|nr:xanthine dehydrogenase family protein molybdopterin-binding subunit [Pseudorhizobium sp.]
MLNEQKIVGFPLPRIDGPLKVTGTAHYAAEFHEPGMLHGCVVPATIASGRITAIDAAEAERFPGVVKVYTHENRPRAARSDKKWKDAVAVPGHPLRPLENDRILYDGQPVALVVAETYEAARDAAELVRVTYAADAPKTDIQAERANSYVPPEARKEKMSPADPRGDWERAYAEAPHKITAEYVQQGEHHNPMELFGSTAIRGEDGFLTVYDKTQGSQNSHDYVCNVFGLKPESVRVVNAFVGGAFGSGLRPKHQLFFAVMASLDLERSVRVELSRSEMFYLTWRPATIQRMSLAADADGRLVSVMHHAVQATSVYEDYQENVVNWSGLAYKCDNVKLTYELAKTNFSTPGDMRAPGAATGFLALESAIDELAYEAGMDPLEFRVRNFVTYDQNEDLQITAKALDACYREGAERFGWAKRSMEPGSMRDGQDLVGWGMATGVWEASMAPAEAKVRLFPDGKVTVSAAASDIGTGTYTMLAQIAAQNLGQAVDRVTVLIGDSSLPTTGVQGGSWTAASSGSAVQAGCREVKKTLLSLAQKLDNSPLKDAALDDIAIRDNRLVLDRNDQIGVAIADILGHHGLSSVEGHGKVGPDQEQAKTFVSYTHSAVFVEVRIDGELGVPRVTRVVSAVAAGRIINPKTARSQILGGVVMGLGMALHEEGMVDHRSGRIMNHNLAEYHVPAHADVDDIDVIFIDEEDEKASPIGVKGLGEIGIIGVGAAVANAIFHATGTRHRHFPITLDRIMEGLPPR